MLYGYFQSYIPVLLLFLAALLLAALILAVSFWLRPRPALSARRLETEYPPAVTHTRQHFSPKYCLIAMAFALFDTAALLLYPWAVIFHELRLFGFLEMLLFLALVSAGFVYFWKKGVFDWGEPESEENS